MWPREKVGLPQHSPGDSESLLYGIDICKLFFGFIFETGLYSRLALNFSSPYLSAGIAGVNHHSQSFPSVVISFLQTIPDAHRWCCCPKPPFLPKMSPFWGLVTLENARAHIVQVCQ
jgi:hypothetical protein